MDREEFLEKARKANEEKAKQASLSDLANPNSIVYSREGFNTFPQREPLAPPVAEKQKIDADGLPILDQMHTFAEDINEAVQHNGLSMSKIALAESSSKKDVPTHPFLWTKALLGIFAIIFLIIGTTILFFTLSKKEDGQEVPIVEVKKKVIESREEVIVIPRRKEKRFLLEALNPEKTRIPEKDVLKRIILKEQEGQEGFDLNTLLETLEADIPPALSRSLSQIFDLFIFFETRVGEPVIVFRTNSFEATYPGMLEWEKNLGKDMEGIFGIEAKEATTTPKIFQDRVILNKDTRVLYRKDGSIIFFYTILEQKFIVLSKSINGLKEIQKRIRESEILGNRGM